MFRNAVVALLIGLQALEHFSLLTFRLCCVFSKLCRRETLTERSLCNVLFGLWVERLAPGGRVSRVSLWWQSHVWTVRGVEGNGDAL